ncbi:ABC transporter substrate-binding protein [Umezawaea endophytica]|uniref:Extracellular solute-binding protein n=1 Tax=Umezawaea endophytica TaxID=1654476 RepID=A0A9X2VK43_9PSEU|nr:extracellular solute-binding protein [Umezawaea endophytica]MCS7478001.1 extracellular solute-binding protein [Umezawaea endophytica]
MPQPRTTVVRALATTISAALLLTACGAGSRTSSSTAAQVDCDFPAPSKATSVNVLAYNSSAIDPFTNTMVKSCSKNQVTVKHEPIDFAGQVQKTTATLAGDTGTYDVVETYGFIIPKYAGEQKLRPLDEYVAEFDQEYGLSDINKAMRQAMSYDGKLYGLPMQAQMYVMAYRKDVFESLGLKPPTTFAELRDVAGKIQQAGQIKYPVALPLLASSDIATAYDSALGSLGVDYVDATTMTPNFDKPEAAKAFDELRSLAPFMDPQVTTFDQPRVQQQMYNGSAAVAIMFSGRMNDLTQASNSKFSQQFGFAPPPSVAGGDVLYNTLSVDGWSIPTNAAADPKMLFEMIASSVSADASKASVPAAYPARDGIVTPGSSPYAEAAQVSIGKAPPAEPHPWTSRISNDTRTVVADVVLGNTPVAEGTAQMQQIAAKILAEYKK